MGLEGYCKICNDGKLFKNLNLHLRGKHRILRADYERKFSAEEEKLEEKREEEVISKEEDLDVKDSRDISLKSFLDTYGLTEPEVREMLGVRRALGSSDLRTQLKIRQDNARSRARDVIKSRASRDLHGPIKTTDLDVAEVLVNEFGYRCDKVVAPKGDEPKHWVLEK